MLISCTTHILCQRMEPGAIRFELTLSPTLTHCASDTRWPSCLPSICHQNHFLQHHFEITYNLSLHHCTEGPTHLDTDPDRSWKLPSWFCRSGRDQVFLQEKSRRPSFLSSLLCSRGSSLSSGSRCILNLLKVWLEKWLDLVDLTSDWWGHPVASMCRPLLNGSFNGDIASPENADFFKNFRAKISNRQYDHSWEHSHH